MEKSSNCFPSFKCLRKKKSSSKVRSSIRMPSIKEFLNRPITTGTQTLESKRNFSETSTMVKSVSTHKSSLVIKRPKGISADSMDQSIKSINLSTVLKPGLMTSNRSTFFLSKGSFDEMFASDKKIKAEQGACTSRPLIGGKFPFVIENERLKVVPVTPCRRKRGSSYGSKPKFQVKVNPFDYVREIVKNRRVSSGQWDKDLEEINFTK